MDDTFVKQETRCEEWTLTDILRHLTVQCIDSSQTARSFISLNRRMIRLLTVLTGLVLCGAIGTQQRAEFLQMPLRINQQNILNGQANNVSIWNNQKKNYITEMYSSL